MLPGSCQVLFSIPLLFFHFMDLGRVVQKCEVKLFLTQCVVRLWDSCCGCLNLNSDAVNGHIHGRNVH